MLETGHKYVLLLDTSDQGEKFGASEYWNNVHGFSAFQVTDGVVHVLNHPIAEHLSEQYNGMALEDFLVEVGDIAALGTYYDPVGPQPSPGPGGASPTTEPVDSEPPATTIQSVGIDMDVAGNAPNSLGAREICGTASAGHCVGLGQHWAVRLSDHQALSPSLVNAVVVITGGTGEGQIRQIIVGDDALTVDPPWAIVPDDSSMSRNTVAVDIVA